MKIFGGFDGLSCGQIALNRSGVEYSEYFASEIESKAIEVCQSNYPNTIQLGDITKIEATQLVGVNLFLGGSPCQDISNLNKNSRGLKGEKSSLFYYWLRLLREVNPKWFLLENVNGNKESVSTITKELGVRPLRLNANMVSAQNRNRLYWTNIPVNSLPIKKYISLSDILQTNVDEKYFLKDGRLKWLKSASGEKSCKKRFTGVDPIKAGCLTRRGEKSWNCTYVTENNRIRTLTPVEYERLQCVPDNYTISVEDSYRYEMLGNGWNIDIIAHIFKHINISK